MSTPLRDVCVEADADNIGYFFGGNYIPRLEWHHRSGKVIKLTLCIRSHVVVATLFCVNVITVAPRFPHVRTLYLHAREFLASKGDNVKREVSTVGHRKVNVPFDALILKAFLSKAP